MNAEEAATKIASLLRMTLDDGVEVTSADMTLVDKSGTFAVEVVTEDGDDDEIVDIELVKYEPGKRLLLEIPSGD